MNTAKYFLIIGGVLLLGCSKRIAEPILWNPSIKKPTTCDFLFSEGFKEMGYNPLLNSLFNTDQKFKKILYSMPYQSNDKIDTLSIILINNDKIISRTINYHNYISSYSSFSEKYFHEEYPLSVNLVDSIAFFNHYNGKDWFSAAVKLNYNNEQNKRHISSKSTLLQSSNLYLGAYAVGDHYYYDHYYYDVVGADIGINNGKAYFYDPIHHWPYFKYPSDVVPETDHKIAFASKYDLDHSKDKRSEILTINLIDNFSEARLLITCRNKLTYDSLNRLMSVETTFFSESRNGVETVTASSTYKYIGEYDILETYTVKSKGKKKEVYTITYHLTPQE